MVSRSKKLVYSCGSIILGTAIFATLLWGLASRTPGVVGTTVIFAAAVAGWIIAIPLILIINDISGWRFWLYLGMGTSSGPILVFATILVPFIKHAMHNHTPASAVSSVILTTLGLFAIPFFVGTLTYLSWLRKVTNQ